MRQIPDQIKAAEAHANSLYPKYDECMNINPLWHEAYLKELERLDTTCGS